MYTGKAMIDTSKPYQQKIACLIIVQIHVMSLLMKDRTLDETAGAKIL